MVRSFQGFRRADPAVGGTGAPECDTCPRQARGARAWAAGFISFQGGGDDGATVPHKRAEILAAPMHPKTINIHLEFFFSAFRRFIAEGEVVGESPFDALRFEARALRPAVDEQEGRDAWPRAHLQTLFDSPLRTGCKGATRRKEPGTVVIEDG